MATLVLASFCHGMACPPFATRADARNMRDHSTKRLLMRFAVRYNFRNPQAWRIPPAQLYNRLLDQIEWVDKNGFDAVVFAEHHCTDDDFMPSLMTICAATAARTKRV